MRFTMLTGEKRTQIFFALMLIILSCLTFSFPGHDSIERKQLLDYNWKFAPGDHLLLKVINNKK